MSRRITLIRSFAAIALAAGGVAVAQQQPLPQTPAAAVEDNTFPLLDTEAAAAVESFDLRQLDENVMLAQADPAGEPQPGEAPSAPPASAAPAAAPAPSGSTSDIEARMRARIQAQRSGNAPASPEPAPTRTEPTRTEPANGAATGGFNGNTNATRGGFGNGGFGGNNGGFGRGNNNNGNRGGFGGRTAMPARNTGPTSMPAAGDYSVIVEQNMFLRERHRPRPIETTSRPVVPPLTPEQTYVLRGVLLEDDGFRAYFENIQTNTAVQVGPGDPLARGHVVEISIDAVSFERDGQLVWVNVGSNLNGTQVSAPPPRPSYPTAGTTGGGTTSGGQMSPIEAQMRARLEAARNRR